MTIQSAEDTRNIKRSTTNIMCSVTTDGALLVIYKNKENLLAKYKTWHCLLLEMSFQRFEANAGSQKSKIMLMIDVSVF